MAMSALFYGYAGNSANSAYSTPPTAWWDEKRIMSTVTRSYIMARLGDEQRRLLDDSVSFGQGLTDETYCDWILTKAKRLFLILTDVGLPEAIFRIIDQSLDDEDLPLTHKSLEHLAFSDGTDETLAKKFYKRQFTYMLRSPVEGNHISYAADEVVPIEPIMRRPTLVGLQAAEKVIISNKGDKVFVRRRISLGEGDGKMHEQVFLHDVEAMKSAAHKHLISIFATYTYQDAGYVLLTPACDIPLKNFIQIPPPHFRNLEKQERRKIILSWLHCLSEALTFVHDKNIHHGEVQPSNIFIDSSNNIILGVISSYRKLRTDRRPNTLESYEYGPPEKWVGATNASSSLSLRRKASTTRKWKLSIQSAPTPVTESFNFSSGDCSPISAQSWPTRSANIGNGWKSDPYDSQKADIFSLGCVYLDILSFLMKKKLASFVSQRSAKNKKGWNSAPPDTSFHANREQVDEWIDMLRKDSFRRKEQVFDGVPAILATCQAMLGLNPNQRPEAWEIEEKMADIITGMCRIQELHCGHHAEPEGQWDFCCSGNVRDVPLSRLRNPQRTASNDSAISMRQEVKPWELPANPVTPSVVGCGVAY